MFKPVLSAINQAGGGTKFADGGLTPDLNQIRKVSGMDMAMTAPALMKTNQNIELLTQAVRQNQEKLTTLKVVNVVSETTRQQNVIKNIENEAIF